MRYVVDYHHRRGTASYWNSIILTADSAPEAVRRAITRELIEQHAATGPPNGSRLDVRVYEVGGDAVWEGTVRATVELEEAS